MSRQWSISFSTLPSVPPSHPAIIDRKAYSKHEYAVWTCRLNAFNNSFVCGDEVNSIYLYNDGKLTAKNSSAHTGGLCDLSFLN